MNKLLVSNFTHLFKSVLFKICLLFSAGMAIFSDCLRYIDIKKNPEIYAQLDTYRSADCFLFSGALYMIFVIAIFVGIFVGTEYSDGTIRNKLAIGHKRSAIYIANFVTCSVASVLLMATYIIFVFALGMILLEKPYLTTDTIIIFSLMQIFSGIALTALFVFFTMIINSKVGSSVTILVATMIMFLTAMTIGSSLNQNEYYTDYHSYGTDEETGEIIMKSVTVKNPDYLTGTKREIYEFFHNLLPVDQIYQVMQEDDKNLDIMAVYSAILIILVNGAGVIIFRKKDLK